MTLMEMTEKFKNENCKKCSAEQKEKCEGIAITIDGKLRCINNQNSIEE
jgi:cell division protein ZapA (FtsZ GTPase activity inhibitor)